MDVIEFDTLKFNFMQINQNKITTVKKIKLTYFQSFHSPNTKTTTASGSLLTASFEQKVSVAD